MARSHLASPDTMQSRPEAQAGPATAAYPMFVCWDCSVVVACPSKVVLVGGRRYWQDLRLGDARVYRAKSVPADLQLLRYDG